MSEPTLFEKIIAREIPADIVFEDERVIAFRDINPQAPMHILVCPKKPIPKVSEAAAADSALLGEVMLRAAAIAADEGYGDAFRLVVNNGAAVGQTVFHIHVHLLGGRNFAWPPG
ncbi:MAG: histidine triad nucleotide-binding protein [Gammaproteobacteria bacterium]